MRHTRLLIATALVFAVARTALAQATLPPPTDLRDVAASSLGGTPYGNVDFGGRFTDLTGDAARYQRYRDLRDGAFAQNVNVDRRGGDWTFAASANNVGYRDQRYRAEYRSVGTLKIGFLWDQIPLFISGDTRTLYAESQPGVFRLDDAMQTANQAGLTTIRNYTDRAALFETRTRRDIGAVDLVFNATRELDLKVNVTTIGRSGSIPYGGSFGFSNLVELPAPIDQRTTDAKTLLEWANRNALVSVGWDASWFDNRIDAMIWDNPLKITDSPSYSTAYSDGKGPAQARMALWPSNTQQYVHGTGSFSMPGRGRLTAYLAVGAARQDAALLPHTINSQIPVIPLERPSADAEVRNTMFNVQYTSRPVRTFGFSARYRHADVDNRTPHFETLGRVRFDGVYDNAENSPEPEFYGSTSKSFDLDGTFSGVPFTSFKIGYGNAMLDRTFRIFQQTKENTFRASVDTTGNPYVMVRAAFEDSSRTGHLFDEHLLGEVGEQPGMRHFDVANRDRRRFTVIASVTPLAMLGFNASAGIGRDEYPDSEFGLQAYDSDQYSVGMDIVPNDRVGFNLVYAWENYTSMTQSRTASPGPQFTDPTRNWWMDYTGRVKNVDASLDVLHVAPRTDLRLSVNWSDANDVYRYRLAPNSPVTTPLQLDPVINTLMRSTADVIHRINTHLRLGVAYWYEDYNTQDFALGPLTMSDIALPPVQPGLPIVPTNSLLLGYLYRPYTAHTAMVRLTYLW